MTGGQSTGYLPGQSAAAAALLGAELRTNTNLLTQWDGGLRKTSREGRGQGFSCPSRSGSREAEHAPVTLPVPRTTCAAPALSPKSPDISHNRNLTAFPDRPTSLDCVHPQYWAESLPFESPLCFLEPRGLPAPERPRRAWRLEVPGTHILTCPRVPQPQRPPYHKRTHTHAHTYFCQVPVCT